MRVRLGVHVPHTPVYITTGSRRHRRSRGNATGAVSGIFQMLTALLELSNDAMRKHQAKINSPEYLARHQERMDRREAKHQANHEYVARFRAEQAGRNQWPYIIGVLLVLGVIAGIFFWPVLLLSIVGLCVWFPLARRSRRQETTEPADA